MSEYGDCWSGGFTVYATGLQFRLDFIFGIIPRVDEIGGDSLHQNKLRWRNECIAKIVKIKIRTTQVREI